MANWISFKGNTIENEGAKEIAEALKDNTSLKNLDLQRTNCKPTAKLSRAFLENKIRSVGGTALWEALKTNTALTELNLRNPNLASEIQIINTFRQRTWR